MKILWKSLSNFKGLSWLHGACVDDTKKQIVQQLSFSMNQFWRSLGRREDRRS